MSDMLRRPEGHDPEEVESWWMKTELPVENIVFRKLSTEGHMSGLPTGKHLITMHPNIVWDTNEFGWWVPIDRATGWGTQRGQTKNIKNKTKEWEEWTNKHISKFVTQHGFLFLMVQDGKGWNAKRKKWKTVYYPHYFGLHIKDSTPSFEVTQYDASLWYDSEKKKTLLSLSSPACSLQAAKGSDTYVKRVAHHPTLLEKFAEQHYRDLVYVFVPIRSWPTVSLLNMQMSEVHEEFLDHIGEDWRHQLVFNFNDEEEQKKHGISFNSQDD